MQKISVVVTGRNDDYDGNFDERLSVALSKNISALPGAEYIFVEWNPIPDKTTVCEKLQKLFGTRIQYYVVDPRFHGTYCLIDGFIEYPAKNVGIRRASGNFILCTNSDIVFSPELVEKLKRPLDLRTVYRATRVDIKQEYMDVQFPLDPNVCLARNKGYMNAAGDFLLAHKKLWEHVTGYCEAFPEQRLHKDAYIMYKLCNVHKFPWADLGDVTHWRHPSSWSSMGPKRPGVGDIKWNFRDVRWDKNPNGWGLANETEEMRDGITWIG